MVNSARGRWLGLAAVVVVCSAHVGSPDVYYEGSAGPYRVLVVVRMPGVVPGVAQIVVRVTGAGAPPERVAVGVNHFDAATAPPLEDAVRQASDPASFAGKLWVMSGGSNAVTVQVVGPSGSGSVVVPVVAVATRRLPLYRWLGLLLGIIGVVLFIGAVSIVGAAVRESTLAPGATPDPKRRAMARIAMGATAIVMAGLLYFGRQWWVAEDTAFQHDMYRPMAARAEIRGALPNGARELAFVIADSDWTHRGDTTWLREHDATSWSPLIPDHGKLVHLFLVGESAPTAFAHLHPATKDSNTFVSILPPLVAGHYRVFADIVHESGFDQTLVASIDLPAPVAAPRGRSALTDSDDAWTSAQPVRRGEPVALGDGSTLQWLPQVHAAEAGGDAGLQFVVQGPRDQPVTLEPYMGMAGHAVVVSQDGAVFIHLHPMGTISSASQMAFMVRTAADTAFGAVARRLATAGMSGMSQGPGSDTLTFPYAFPRPGHYRVWIQVKRNGRILTAPIVADIGGSAAAPSPSGAERQATAATPVVANNEQLAARSGRWHQRPESQAARTRGSLARRR